MSFERYTQIYDGGKLGMTLRPKGEEKSLSFDLEPKENVRYRLFTVGETEQYYMWKDEPDGPFLYRSISDALNTEHAIRDRYCLDLSCKKYENYIKRVYRKIAWPPKLSYLRMNPVPTAWQAGLCVSAKGLSIEENGFLQMRVDIRLCKEGVDPRSVSGEPDHRIVIPIPEGSYEAKQLCVPIDIPSDTAHVGVFIEGIGYRGQCYVEAPFLLGDGQNLLPSFNESVADKENLDWTAQYLSRKEWPEFRVRLNGHVIFSGEVFERSHRHSEWEIKLPSRYLQEQNTLTYELTSDYHDPLPYTLYEIGVIEQPKETLSVLAVSEAAPAHGCARVLLRTEKPNLRVTLSCPNGALSGKKEWLFRQTGLHGMLLDCGEPCEHASFRLSWEGGEVTAEVGRIVRRSEDRVITGTGDMIYIHQDMDSMEEYLSWYLSNQIGDLITIRPTYRWSGTRTINERVWKKFRRLMNELGLKYVLMADGREIPGLSTQPSPDMLRGRGFLGTQLHEEDGAQYYWNVRKIVSPTVEMNTDLLHFAYEEKPEITSSRYGDALTRFINGNMYFYADRQLPKDYRLAHERSVASLAQVRRERDTRHTGPSCMFKYMHEAGYSWLGAETMYSTMEPLMGFLRGVAKENDMQTYGVHHAVQWSSTPHASPARYRRYRLALYASYILGATDINTEEGLWHLEEYYEHHHRFGVACREHLKQHQDFYRYVSTHSRTGRFVSPAALLHGRDDGITFFGKHKTWGIMEPQSAAEDSWDLITAIYPKANPGVSVYRHGCPENVPQGYHSGTPYGNVDAIPAEGKLQVWRDYRALVFLGYNRCTQEDAEKLQAYVKQGGTVLLTRAHLTNTSDMADVRHGKLSFAPHAMSLCGDEPSFVCDTVDGVSLFVCDNADKSDEVTAYTDNGLPLVCVYGVGKGKIVLFNTKEYPSHSAIRSLHEAELQRVLQEANDGEKIWAVAGDDVEFAAYDQEDGTRHLYFLATDWYRDPAPLRHATVRVGQDRYDLTLPFGTLIKCVSDGSCAAWPESEDGEVLSVKDGVVTVQGTGCVSFVIAKDGKQTVKTVDFSKASVQTL